MATQTNRLVVISANGEPGRNQPADLLEVGSSWKTVGTGTFDFGSTGAISSSGVPASFTMGVSGAVSLTGGAASGFTTSAGALTLTGAAGVAISSATLNLTLDAPGGGQVGVGTGAGSGAINIGTSGNRTISIGNGAGISTISINPGGSGYATVNGGVTVSNGLIVQGGSVLLQSEAVRIAANHLILNDGYTGGGGQTGGLVINYQATATSTAVAAGGFTAGVVGVSNPTVATVGAATFAAGDVVQVSGTAHPKNGGLFEVHTHAANVLTIRGIGVSPTTQDWVQPDFQTDAAVSGSLFKVNVSILRSSNTGEWQTSKGSSTTGMVFTNLGGITLQTAYNASASPPTITTVAGGGVGQGPVSITGTESLTVMANNGFIVGGVGGGQQRPATLNATTFNATTTTSMVLDATGGTIGIGSGPTAVPVNIGTGGNNRQINIGSAGGTGTQFLLQGGAGSTHGIATNASDQGVNIGTGAASMNVQVGSSNTSSQLTLRSGSNTMLLDAGGPLTIQQSQGSYAFQQTGSAGKNGVAQPGPVAAGNGGNFTITAGGGGAGAANGIAGQTAVAGFGAPLGVTAGKGGNGASNGAENTPGVVGGALTLNGGQGGDGTATVANGSGGGLVLTGGGPGAPNGGPGGGTGGAITIGNTNTSTVNIATANNHTVNIGHNANANATNINTGGGLLTVASGTGGTSITSTSVATTAINISATSGTTNIEARDNNAGVFTVKEGANNYISVDTLNGNEAINVNQFLSAKMAGMSLTSGEVLNLNDVVTVDATVGGGRLIQSDANGAAPRTRVIGVVQNSAGGAGVAVRVVTRPGSLVTMNFDAAPAAVNQGSVVYLHTVAGQVSLSPTAVGGETVFEVGILQNATGPQVLFFPQFIKVN